jgi:hypothetical protein
MRTIAFTILPLLFLVFQLNSNSNLGENIEKKFNQIRSKEYQAIKILFSNIKPEELKNENFGIIISHSDEYIINYRPTNIIVCFKYNFDDKYITLNYFSFPQQEKIDIPYYDKYSEQFEIFIEEIICNKKIVSIKEVKQLEVPLPIGLQDNILLNKMYNNNKLYYPHRITLGGDLYYLGFKYDKVELVRDNFSYYGELSDKIKYNILDPIMLRIYYHETPEEWKEGYERYSKKYRITNSINEYLKEIGIIQ